MLFNSILTKNSFLLYAAKHYENPQCLGSAEFNNDMKRFMYINRILKKYKRKKDINHRLLINHFIVLNNVFRPEPLNRMIYFYCDEELHNFIYTILTILNIISQNVPEVNVKRVKIDKKLMAELESATKG